VVALKETCRVLPLSPFAALVTQTLSTELSLQTSLTSIFLQIHSTVSSILLNRIINCRGSD